MATLDTHAIARTLTDAGADPKLADAITAAVREAADHGDHVTPDQFKAGLAEMEARLTWRFAGGHARADRDPRCSHRRRRRHPAHARLTSNGAPEPRPFNYWVGFEVEREVDGLESEPLVPRWPSGRPPSTSSSTRPVVPQPPSDQSFCLDGGMLYMRHGE